MVDYLCIKKAKIYVQGGALTSKNAAIKKRKVISIALRIRKTESYRRRHALIMRVFFYWIKTT